MLYLHRAERADALAGALAALLAEPLADPFTPEIVAVPTRGMERWLSQRMSHRLGASGGHGDGVCANVEFPFPGTLIGEALASATGLDPDADPWPPERSVWPLLEVIHSCQTEPWLEPVARYLGVHRRDGADPDLGHRFAGVRRIADLYDRYAIHRPQMVRAWAGGEDVDGSAKEIAADCAWQPRLWRTLRGAVGSPSPAERLGGACDELRARPELLAWPSRISVFPLTRLPASYLQVLAAIAAGRDVHLFVLHASPVLWEKVAGLAGEGPHVLLRASDPSAALPSNPILASWGRDARELQLVLANGEESVDQHHPLSAPSPALLGRLQADIRADRAPPGEPLPGAHDGRALLEANDTSLRVHACHGRARQVEVVREAILHLLEQDQTLEPRDVIVMCPDIEVFAPLIQAAFGAGEVVSDEEGEGTPRWRPADLRVRLADRSLRQINPVLGAVAQLLELADARVTASQLLAFADREPVRRRFGFDDDALARVQDWVVEAGIHWGLDASHRAPFKLSGVSSGTWQAGLDRILLGATMSAHGLPLFKGVLPLGEVGSGAIELAGRFAEYVERMRTALDTLAGPQPVHEWCAAIAAAADALTLTRDRESWQRRELGSMLEAVRDEAIAAGQPCVLPIALSEIRSLLADRLRGRPTRANFRTGHLTVCTLVPMRSVPHRVICLLGLDDGAFPRRALRDGDDLASRDPHIGDRDPRAEDRQMLLDALLAASEHLIVTYTGNDERTNAPRPPAVPVAELLDCVDRTVRSGSGGPAREQVLVSHPLQPFDKRNFEPGVLAKNGPWSFDRAAFEGARALTRERSEPPAFLAESLPAFEAPVIELRSLEQFMDGPIRGFLRQRLGITVRDEREEIDDFLPIELDSLGLWGVGQRLLDARLAGLDWKAAKDAEIARGELPPGRLGAPAVLEQADAVEAIAQATLALRTGKAARSLDVRLQLADGRVLVGTVGNLYGDLLQTTTYSRLSAQHRLGARVRFLALNAQCPDRAWRAATVGRLRSGAYDGILSIARIPPLAEDPSDRRRVALKLLARLIDVYDRGMREPLPIARKTTAAYAEAIHRGDDAFAAARSEWDTARYPENEDEAHQMVFGSLAFQDLYELLPRADECGDGWEQSEPSRFGRYARRLWADLLAREQVSDQ